MIAQLQENQESRKRTAKVDTFGTQELCSWQVATGVFWFQTRRPEIAEKFRHRRSARLVACSVSGGYLRIFEEAMEPKRARDLVRRFLTVSNKPFSRLKRRLARRNRRQG